MNKLDSALSSLKANLGEFDNVKLLLGGGESMTREAVDAEFLAIAEKLQNGEVQAISSFKETKLKEASFAI